MGRLRALCYATYRQAASHIISPGMLAAEYAASRTPPGAQAAYHLELARVGRTHDHGDGCPPRQVPA